MMFLFFHTLFEFYNVVFLAAFAFAMIFLILQVMGVIGDSPDAEIETEADLESPEIETELDGSFEGSESVLNKLLSFFGIGKAPIGIWLFVFSFVFGLVGLVCNLILFKQNPSLPAVFFPFILIGGFMSALFLSKFISKIIGNILPNDSSHSIQSKYELIEKEGKIRFDLSTDKIGSMMVIDQFDNIQNVDCKLAEQYNPAIFQNPIPEGTKVKIIDFNEEQNAYTILPVDYLLTLVED